MNTVQKIESISSAKGDFKLVASATSSSTSSSYRAIVQPRLLVVAVILCVLGSTMVAESFVVGSRPLSKRSFFDIQCKGVYDKDIFTKLDRVCDDCYNLYREPQLHTMCRHDCFSTKIFPQCLEALELQDQMNSFMDLVFRINAVNPFEGR